MRAEVVILVSDADLVDPTDPVEALARARGVVSKLGTPDDGEITASLFGDGFRVVFLVDAIAVNA